MSTAFVKDVLATLDYAIDWGAWLNGDTIASSTWTLSGPDAALTIVSSSIAPSASTGAASSQAVVWLSGGTLGATYELTNRITTTSAPFARVQEQTLQFTIAQL